MDKNEKELKRIISEKYKIDLSKNYNIFLCYRDSTAILARNFYDYVQKINVSLYDTRYYGNIYYSDYVACGKYTDYKSLKKLIKKVKYFIIFLDKNFTMNFTDKENEINDDCVTAHEIKYLLERKRKPKIIIVNVNGYNFKDFYNEQYLLEKVEEYIDEKEKIEKILSENYFELTNLDKKRIMDLLDKNPQLGPADDIKRREKLAEYITNGNNINNFDVRQGDEISFFERLLPSIKTIPIEEVFYIFGKYPQDQLSSKEIKKENLITPDFEEWNSYNYSYNGKKKDYMKYYDVENRIRIVKFTEFRPCLVSGLPNGYQERNGYECNKDYYFYYEPLMWRKLYEDREYIYLCTKNIIDSQPICDANYDELKTMEKPNDFDNSYIKKWLNNEFYNRAFNDEEKKLIDNTYGITLISVNEIKNYMMSMKRNKIDATKYARCQGIYSFDENYDWGLRDGADDNSFDIKFICGNKFDEIREDLVIYTNGGVVPLLRIDKDNISLEKSDEYKNTYLVLKK